MPSAILGSRPCPSAIFPYCTSAGGALTVYCTGLTVVKELEGSCEV